MIATRGVVRRRGNKTRLTVTSNPRFTFNLLGIWSFADGTSPSTPLSHWERGDSVVSIERFLRGLKHRITQAATFGQGFSLKGRREQGMKSHRCRRLYALWMNRGANGR